MNLRRPWAPSAFAWFQVGKSDLIALRCEST
jgi:hypothetical protein